MLESSYIENIGVNIFQEEKDLEQMMKLNPFDPEIDPRSTVLSEKERTLKKKLWNLCVLADAAVSIKYPHVQAYNTLDSVYSVLQFICEHNVPVDFNVGTIADYVALQYRTLLDISSQLDVQEVVTRIVEETKLLDKQVFGVPTSPTPGMQHKINKNHLILGQCESAIDNRNKEYSSNALDVVGKIKYFNRSAKEEVGDIRAALNRLPANVLVFSREFKNKLYLHAYLNELRKHNASILAVREFIEWVNISSNRDYKEDDQETPAIAAGSQEEASVDSFNWPNLLMKVSKLVGHPVGKNKIRSSLSNWLNILKRRHEFLLYWNLDSNVMVLCPALLSNFPALVSSYVIRYLQINYEKIKVEAESIG